MDDASSELSSDETATMFHPQLTSYVRHYGALYRIAFPSLTWRRATDRREVYLTFDDGPLPGGTDQILDVLKALDVRATFFWVGQNIEDHPALLRRALDAGHSIGNHGYVHESGWRQPVERYVEGVWRCQSLLPPRETGLPLFRPPFGKLTPRQIEVLKDHFEIVMWDLMTGDFDQGTEPTEVLRLVERRARPGSILLFHDGASAIAKNRELLPEVVDLLARQGYELAPL